jgi:hypothetical protein
MKSTRPLTLPFLITLAAAIAATFPPMWSDQHSSPLHGRWLAAIHGANRNFKTFGNSSCDGLGDQALTQLFGGSWVPQSGCGIANIGFNCGGCTVTMSWMTGSGGGLVPPGEGQQLDDLGACGGLVSGTCIVTNPGGYPLNYACGNEAPVLNKNGQQYTCSDAIGIEPQ